MSGRQIPRWILTTLIENGTLDPTGATRYARAKLCARCRAPVMRALDRDTGPRKAVELDVAPLDDTGELLALLAGRTTFVLTWTGPAGYRVDERTLIRVQAAPASTLRDGGVHVEHACGSPPLPVAIYPPGPPLPAAAARLKVTANRQEPPF